MTNIDGTRPIETVWVDTKAFIERTEQRLAAPRSTCEPSTASHRTRGGRASHDRPARSSARLYPRRYRLHLYVSEPSVGSSYITDVDERIAADAARRWGDGAVTAEGCAYSVQRSFKAFDLESLRAFD